MYVRGQGRLVVRVMAQSGISVCEGSREARSQGDGTKWDKCM